MIKRVLTSLTLLSLSSLALGAPRIDSREQIKKIGSLADADVQILVDADDSDLYYIPPKRVILSKSPFNERKIFRLSYSNTNQDGQFHGVFELGFDRELVLAQWNEIKSFNPNSRLASLPIKSGEFGLEFRDETFSLLIGRAEVVQSDLESGQIPVYIYINQLGLNVLRANAQTPNQHLLVLNFGYQVDYFFESDPHIASASLRLLMEDMTTDATLQSAWEKAAMISRTELESYLLRAYAKNLWFSPETSNIRIIARSLISALQQEGKLHVGEGFDMRHKTFLTQYTAMPADTKTFELLMPGEVRTVRDSAGVLLAGLCDTEAQSIYVQETGEARCLDFPTGNTPPPGGGIWLPF